MTSSFQLPARDDLGFCNILLSALGGDGANMAAKLLFKIGCIDFGLDGGYDAKYGSEKKGTPTDVSVRFCMPGTPVRQSGPTSTPHFLVVFHGDLIAPLELGRGLQEKPTCIFNAARRPEELQSALMLQTGRIVCVDATRIAFECGSRLNMPLLAALCHAMKFPDERIKDVIAHQWPKAAKANLAAFDRALGEAASAKFAAAAAACSRRAGAGDAEDPHPAGMRLLTRGPIGWRNMLNGGTIDALAHSTIGRDNRIAGQGKVPRFAPEACSSCGICMTVCSDPGGLLWKEGRMTGIDDRFCKGCMRCVEVCPDTKKGKALTAALER